MYNRFPGSYCSLVCLLEVDGVDDVPNFLSSKDGLQALVLDVSQEGILPASLHLLSSVKVSHRLLVLFIQVSRLDLCKLKSAMKTIHQLKIPFHLWALPSSPWACQIWISHSESCELSPSSPPYGGQEPGFAEPGNRNGPGIWSVSLSGLRWKC